MKPKLLIAALNVIVDASTQIPSAINIMNGFGAESFPFRVPELHILSVWERESADGLAAKDLSLKVSMGGSDIFDKTISLDLSKGTVVRSLFKIKSMVINGPGEILITAAIEGVRINYALTVLDRKASPEAK